MTIYRHILVNYYNTGESKEIYSTEKDIDVAIKKFNKDALVPFTGGVAFTNEQIETYEGCKFIWGNKIY